MRSAQLIKGLAALMLLVLVIVGVPVLLSLLHLVPHGLPALDEVIDLLRSRDDGQLIQVVLAAGAWVCWLLFTASTAAEIYSLARARPALALPGLRLFQQPAAALLAAVAVGLTVSPIAPGTSEAGPASSRPPLPVAISSGLLPPPPGTQVTAVLQTASAPSTPDEPAPAPIVYEVGRRDTLWALAQRFLGDPLRYSEIVKLNPTAVGPDNEIVPGTALVLPPDATGLPSYGGTGSPGPAAVAMVTVQPGDTLWSIAEETSGDGENWQEVWEANKGRGEPDGAVFTDPALIRPGWELSIPGASGPVPPPEQASDPLPDKQADDPPAGPALPPPDSVPSETLPAPVPTSTSTGGVGAEPSTDVHSETEQAPDSALGFYVGGTLLAGVSLAALTRYRRRQFRHRRPGRLIASTPPELVRAERVLQSAGSADVTWLDQALRSLVHALSTTGGARLPDVIAVCMTDDVLTLVLTSPMSPAPAPWTVDEAGSRWSVRRGDPLPYDDVDRSRFFAPFPALTSVGSTAAGEHWLLDLERIGAMSIVGSAHRGLDLVRFLAAELAHNTWSEMLNVTMIGFGAELAGLNPDRLISTEDVGTAIAALSKKLEAVTQALEFADTDVLDGRLRDVDADSWAPHVLLVAPGGAEDGDQLQQLLTALKKESSRSAAAVITVRELDPHTDAEDDGCWQLPIDGGGVLLIPALGLKLRAHQLPAAEAGDLAQMLALAARTEDRPTPPAHGAERWDEHADACGALRTDLPDHSTDRLTERDAVGDQPMPQLVEDYPRGSDSVLPLPNQSYLDRAATTEIDLRTLAPGTDEAVRRRVEDADPDLDRDLADWADPSSPRPKLTVLGPVEVRAQGSLPERNPRRQFYTEIVAYLATQPGGATSERYATAIWPDEPDVVGKTKVRQAISVVRAWLGTDPVTGVDYLPSGLTAAAAGRYRINGILIDAELFRRLRVRGQARGADGLADLSAALDLVSGRPFDVPPPRRGAAGGYAWLVDAGSRLDHEYAAMIVDVAHTVATQHLGGGQPGLAAAAAHVALKSGSYEDVPLLDLVAACDAQGNEAEADAYVSRILANHDADVEEDLPPRTAKILFRRQWPRGDD
ncbi:putative LysM domain peptidoglycan-binding protein [Modestobacter italicus]|uniref:LysM domain peptidoglycan-binding protein n=1 Tax=Modestobacter italicus (strain DSM 44449 / CECT 9708 / BC 501) TaxID=2732864 RepID=I4F0Q3_MODI5|nr:LysM peptidoglycan-binding domain-containing protein [Modestobacter marinus]CCH89216.1 putative LysM domain peptidoglycan-binding protein [Modestobacter marinus]